MKLNELFRQFAHKTSLAVGSPWATIIALLLVIVWGISGPLFNYSTQWQLVINTGTTIITFLMVFIIQNTQNRDSMAMHLKLDELIRSIDKARNNFINSEEMSDQDLEKLHEELKALGEKYGASFLNVSNKVRQELEKRRPKRTH